jgi:hypothetical protein
MSKLNSSYHVLPDELLAEYSSGHSTLILDYLPPTKAKPNWSFQEAAGIPDRLIPVQLRKLSKWSHLDFKVYLYILHKAKSMKFVLLTTKEIAEHTGKSKSTISNSLRKLQAMGHIVKFACGCRLKVFPLTRRYGAHNEQENYFRSLELVFPSDMETAREVLERDRLVSEQNCLQRAKTMKKNRLST